MKKQLAKVKQQFADLRPGKTFLSDELQAADRRVDYLREALQTLSKALPTPNSGDKKIKKCADYALYSLLKQNEKILANDDGFLPAGSGQLLQPVLSKYSEMHRLLAEELSNFETEVEQNVSIPLHALLETDIPKLKKNLNKHISDRDAASSRLQTAQNRHAEPLNRHHVDPSKLNSLQDDVEEAGQRVEQASDQLAVDMFMLLTQEPEVAKRLLLHAKLRIQYHESVLSILGKIVPDLDKLIDDSSVKPVFNSSLADHLRVTKRKIALPIELCICALYEHGIAEEGLFRVAAGSSKLRRLKLSIDANCFTLPLPQEYKDVHLFTGVLKSYLRELPEPLLSFTLFDEWLQTGKNHSEEMRVSLIKTVLQKLPKENYDNLRYLIKFLSELSKNPLNKMSSYNIAIVMSPNLLWSNNNPDLDDIGYASKTIETLISHSDEFFPGELEIYVTFKRGELFGHEFERNAKYNITEMNTAVVESEGNNSFLDNSSPKPITRRKNKPAPEPPKIDHVSQVDLRHEKPPRQAIMSGNLTINRSTYKSPKTNIDQENNINKMSQSVTNAEDFNSSTTNHVRRKSLDFDHSGSLSSLSCLKSNNGNQKKEIHHVHLTKNDISEPIRSTSTSTVANNEEITFASLPPSVPSCTVQQITAQTATVGRITVTSDNLQQKSNVNFAKINMPKTTPVAAPRPSLEGNKSKPVMMPEVQTAPIHSEDHENDIELRHHSKEEFFATIERGNKPVVPERPPSLRPSSFKIPSRADAGERNSAETNGMTMLERTVMYHVPDKQQVSIIQVKDKVPPGHDTQIAEKERFLGHQPTGVTNFVPLSDLQLSKSDDKSINRSFDFPMVEPTTLQRRQSVGSKPVRPPKPDIVKPNEQSVVGNTFSFNSNDVITSESTETISKPSHTRTMSDGNVVDTLSSGTPSPRAPGHPPTSPRAVLTRPPRPQPPPPPPPTPKPRSSTESTDL